MAFASVPADLYDLVRYVDPITNKVIHIERRKNVGSETACQTYGIVWKNAATVFPDSAYEPGKRMTKTEVAGDDPYRWYPCM